MLQINDNERAWLAFSRGLPSGGTPKMSRILSAVALHTGVSLMELKSRRRGKAASRARQIYCYIARLMTTQSFPQIAMTINRDHTTVVYAFYRIEKLLSEGAPELSADIEAIKAIIYSMAGDNT